MRLSLTVALMVSVRFPFVDSTLVETALMVGLTTSTVQVRTVGVGPALPQNSSPDVPISTGI